MMTIIIAVALLMTFYIVGLVNYAFSDLVRYITNENHGLVSERMTISKNEYGGSVTPWFISQRMIINGEEYTLPLSFILYATGTYTVTYSPHTKIIYEVR